MLGLWWPTDEARVAYLLAALTWDVLLTGIMAKVVISVLGWRDGLPVVVGVVVLLLVEATVRQVNRDRSPPGL